MELTTNRLLTEDEKHLADKLRPIRLALKIAESLLSRGVPTRDTVSQALDITERYCKERVYFDVSSNVIIASQYRGRYKDPLTLMMTVGYGSSNNMIVQDLQQLVRDIVKGMPLEDAITQYKEIEKSGKSYPTWLRTIGNAGMATGIVMLFTNSLANILLTFLVSCAADISINMVTKRKIQPFFTQGIAAFTIVILAAVLAGLAQANTDLFSQLSEIDPSIVVVGGIMTLVAGLSLAATAQDAIDEFYVTAGARFVKTAMLTVGIMAGIVAGMTVVNQFSEISIATEQSPPPSPLLFQIIGAGIAGAAWALYIQSSRAAIFWAGVVSMIGFSVYTIIAPLGVIFASAIASVVIGFGAAVVARFSRSPSIAIINSAIIILVPGYMLYRGLMQITGNSLEAGEFSQGLMTTTMAIATALAIAAGAAIGTSIGRPVRSHMIRLYKYAPKLSLSKRSR